MILVLTLFGFLLYLAVVALKRFLIPWHDSAIDTRGRARDSAPGQTTGPTGG